MNGLKGPIRGKEAKIGFIKALSYFKTPENQFIMVFFDFIMAIMILKFEILI